MSWWFDSWDGPLRVLAVGTCGYAALVCLLRISGKRTLAKFNAFDFVVTVALGSTLGSILLDRTVPLADGIMALALLVGLQYVVAWTSIRWAVVRRATRSEPVMIARRGRMLEGAMRRERVTPDAVLSALRSAGIADLDGVEAVVLETNGDISVIGRPRGPVGTSALADVEGPSG
jgi:uncharacterized membrane protein YcaP (DUF421 family)